MILFLKISTSVNILSICILLFIFYLVFKIYSGWYKLHIYCQLLYGISSTFRLWIPPGPIFGPDVSLPGMLPAPPSSLLLPSFQANIPSGAISSTKTSLLFTPGAKPVLLSLQSYLILLAPFILPIVVATCLLSVSPTRLGG